MHPSCGLGNTLLLINQLHMSATISLRVNILYRKPRIFYQEIGGEPNSVFPQCVSLRIPQRVCSERISMSFNALSSIRRLGSRKKKRMRKILSIGSWRTLLSVGNRNCPLVQLPMLDDLISFANACNRLWRLLVCSVDMYLNSRALNDGDLLNKY